MTKWIIIGVSVVVLIIVLYFVFKSPASQTPVIVNAPSGDSSNGSSLGDWLKAVTQLGVAGAGAYAAQAGANKQSNAVAS